MKTSDETTKGELDTSGSCRVDTEIVSFCFMMGWKGWQASPIRNL